jgi:opacity protein-like surface antigen
MKTKYLLAVLIFPMMSFAQTITEKKTDTESGKFQLGVRTVVSTFSDSKYSGLGLGGQFRLKFGDRLNTEWFADYITTNVDGYANRTDYHIGWTVQYYAFNKIIEKGKFTPYIEAGHCFDYTNITLNRNDSRCYYSPVTELSRWSSAINLGLGSCYNISNNFDVSLAAMYMLHLGSDLHTEIRKGPTDIPTAYLEKGNAGIEGHLLITLSLNVYIGKLWGRG